ncbi:uncharacterized protein RHIMIDRAFT_274986 [Rhizopus microsporus ATCC 52813]|uniref:Uncharacterized protein n=1 Tax=Rhizopus microsporus ATCC 52813 TaxID=1340429 RepID=A0A2G4SEY1_RHIZD|nr:uncharacterized protein RHIMIDRAFT_274986 [Rhizopus microsporus ATCC 52813]PHZ07338.1 hypothetical protein RHIMIDRAFT_274986 [Rhizopus microsporus ATCC 52813]
MSCVPLPTEDMIIEDEASNEAIPLTSQEDVHNSPQKFFGRGRDRNTTNTEPANITTTSHQQ